MAQNTRNRMRVLEPVDFLNYSDTLSHVIPEVHCDPETCGGVPIFTGSRLPLEVIVALILHEETDEDILEGYPRMTKFLLTVIRAAIAANPPEFW